MEIGLQEAEISQVLCTTWLIWHQKVNFQDGGQTVNFEDKDYKDSFWRPFTYLHSKPIRMKIGAAEVEK